MKNYFKEWTFIRFLRFFIGVIVMIQGIQANQWIIIGLGVFFTLLPLFNANACSMGSCGVPPRRRTSSRPDDVTHNVIKR